MKSNITISTNTLVQSEDQFIWYAINSIINYVDEILITDNGSTDQTLKILESINSPKIKLEKLGSTDRNGLIQRRKTQLYNSKSDWIMLLDGDEIWSKENLVKMINELEHANENTYGLVCRTRNCVGDIYHYQDESAGRYHILDQTGHLTIRFIRNIEGLDIIGEYPNESFCINGTKIQDLSDHLVFVDTWYLHTTHLKRSSNRKSEVNVIDRAKKLKLESGLEMKNHEIPEIFWDENVPDFVPRPQDFQLSGFSKLNANALTFLKKIKRNINHK